LGRFPVLLIRQQLDTLKPQASVGLVIVTTNGDTATVTVKEQDAVCPLAAVTVNVFVVVPRGKVEPLAKPAVRTVVAPWQLSVPTGAV
jgi:hypothetical protein